VKQALLRQAEHRRQPPNDPQDLSSRIRPHPSDGPISTKLSTAISTELYTAFFPTSLSEGEHSGSPGPAATESVELSVDIPRTKVRAFHLRGFLRECPRRSGMQRESLWSRPGTL
jgi:hypothetical protein